MPPKSSSSPQYRKAPRNHRRQKQTAVVLFDPPFPKYLRWTLLDVVRAWQLEGDPEEFDNAAIFRRCLLGTHYYNCTTRRSGPTETVEEQPDGRTPQSFYQLVLARIASVVSGIPLSVSSATIEASCEASGAAEMSWETCLDGLTLEQLKIHGL